MAHAKTQLLDGTPLERFRAGLHAYIDLGLARPDEYRLTFASVRIMRDACKTVEAADQSFAMLERGVAELMQAQVFIRGDTTLVAEILWASMHGLVIILLDHSGHVVSNHRTLIDTTVNALIRGFTA